MRAMQLNSTQQNQDDTITSEKHFADESVLINALRAALALLRPHFLYVFKHHVAVSVESFDARE